MENPGTEEMWEAVCHGDRSRDPDDEGNVAVFKAFLKGDEPSDPTVSVLEWVDAFETVVEFDDVGESNRFFFIIR